jgi:hypothetical protein
MRAFHIHIHAAPWDLTLADLTPATTDFIYDGHAIQVLLEFNARVQFESSFEQTSDRFVDLPGLFFEPDGSYAWNRYANPGSQQATEQIQGMLYDRIDHVEYCEAKGHCTLATISQFLEALKGPTKSTVIQLPAEGVFLTEEEFLRLFDDT